MSFTQLHSNPQSNDPSVLTAVLQRLKLFQPFVRPPTSLNLFSRYDGNIIGGALVGTGMAVTGTCPGTVIPQLITGVPSAWPAFIGAMAGGMLWVLVGEQLQRPALKPQPSVRNTFQEHLGVTYPSMALIYTIGCLGIVAASSFLDQVPSNPWLGVRGGIALALAQGFSMLSTKNAICSSGTFEESAQWLLWAFQRAIGRIDGSAALPKPPPCSNAGSLFGIGEFIGASLVARSLGLQFVSSSTSLISDDLQFGKLFLGGMALGFGARLAGGCTSGHGISGMSAMSVASLITVAMMFGTGIAITAVS